MKLYGLKNCDTCRKAMKYLDASGIEYSFADIRDEPMTAAELEKLINTVGDAAINKRSKSWRELDETARAQAPAALLAQNPTLAKRPVIISDSAITVGWDTTAQTAHIG